MVRKIVIIIKTQKKHNNTETTIITIITKDHIFSKINKLHKQSNIVWQTKYFSFTQKKISNQRLTKKKEAKKLIRKREYMEEAM